MQLLKIPTVENDSIYRSVFSAVEYEQKLLNEMFLTDQIDAVNFRIRRSEAGYRSGWHVAGDPTLIIILRGTVRIILRNNDFKDFSSGDMFIAKDFLPENIEFNPEFHGHRAELIGADALEAVHIKLKIGIFLNTT